LATLRRTDAAAAAELKIEDLDIKIADAIKAARFPKGPVTQVYWAANEIFKKAKEKADVPDEAVAAAEESEEEAGETTDE
jgi:hypothetical protein